MNQPRREIQPEDLDYLPERKRAIAAYRLNHGTRASRQGTGNAGNWNVPEPNPDIFGTVCSVVMNRGQDQNG